MPTQSSPYKEFRQRLDVVLRQKDPIQLEAFMINEGQWDADQAHDTEAAMWMMILGSKTLSDLHSEAQRWLTSNGHELEAQAILGRGQSARIAQSSKHPAAPRTETRGRQSAQGEPRRPQRGNTTARRSRPLSS